MAVLNFNHAKNYDEHGADFRFYYEAAKGDTDFRVEYDDGRWGGYIYKPFVAVIWKPLTLFDYDTAYAVWYCVLVLFGALTALKLLQIKCCGIYAALFFIYPLWLNLNYTQISIMLVYFAMIFPISFLTVMVKPYYAIFPILHLAKWRKRITPFGYAFFAGILLVVILSSMPKVEVASAVLVNYTGSKAPIIHLFPAYYILKKWGEYDR